MGDSGNGLADEGKGPLGDNLHVKAMRGVLLERSSDIVARGGGGQQLVVGIPQNKLGGRQALTMFMYFEWLQATRGLAGEVCLIAGAVVASAEAGLGVAEALMVGPEGSVVRAYKARTSTEGGARSIEAITGVSGVLFRTGRTGTRVW